MPMKRALILVSLLGLLSGCTATLFKKDPTQAIVETLAKAQATPTPQVIACKVVYPDGSERPAVCPTPEPKQ